MMNFFHDYVNDGWKNQDPNTEMRTSKSPNDESYFNSIVT